MNKPAENNFVSLKVDLKALAAQEFTPLADETCEKDKAAAILSNTVGVFVEATPHA